MALGNSKERNMAEYTKDDLQNIPAIDKTGKNLEKGVISVEEAKRLSALESTEQPAAPETTTEHPAATTEQAVETTTEQAAATVEDKIIKIGGIEKKRSELLDEFQAEAKIDLSAVEPETQDLLLNNYIDSKHKAAWQQNLTAKSEELSAKRKDVEAQARNIEQRKADLSAKRIKLEAEAKRLREQASKNIKKEELYDEHDRIDPDKQIEYQEKKAAERRLPEITAELAELEQEVVQTDTGRLLANMEIVQTIHPQLSTSKPIKQVIEEIERNGNQEHPDRDKYLDLLEISDFSQSYGIPMEKAAERLIQQGRLLSVREINETTTTTLSPRNTAKESLVADISRNQRQVPAKLPAGGAPPRVQIQPKADLAQQMRKASSAASGGGTSDELRKSGY